MQHATTNFLAAGRLLIPNKSSLFGLIGVEDEPSIKFLQYASVVSKMTYRVPSVHSHYLVFGKSPLINTGGPMRANFLIAGDAVIFAAKRAGTVTYLWGITVENLIAWAPPKKAGELVPEEGIMQSWKSTHSDIKELVALADTETHPLTALADKLMSHLPTFAAAPYYRDSMAERFIVIELDEATGQPAEATVAKLRDDLK